jgi:hypothetical protein
MEGKCYRLWRMKMEPWTAGKLDEFRRFGDISKSDYIHDNETTYKRFDRYQRNP